MKEREGKRREQKDNTIMEDIEHGGDKIGDGKEKPRLNNDSGMVWKQ